MENRLLGELVSEKFTWTIENFSKLNTQKHYSEVFLVGDWKWRIFIFPKGNNVKQLSMYLEVVDASDLPFQWTRYAEFSLTVVNQLNRNQSIKKDTQHDFNASESDWGFTTFLPLTELSDSNKGFLWNDNCIIEAEVQVRKVDIKILEDQGTGSSAPLEPSETKDGGLEPSETKDQGLEPSSVDSVQLPDSSTAPILPGFEQVLSLQEAPSSEKVCIELTDRQIDHSTGKGRKEVPSTPVGKLMDFRGLGRIEETFIPLLEEVCSWHPSLIECQKKRSRSFVEWAFTALGRVLHFLKTMKVKDMTEDRCEQLQILWEELETFKFGLAWLEPSIQSALVAKKLVERAGQFKKQREDLEVLEIDVKRLRARLAIAEVDLEVAKRDLAKTEEGFGDTDVNKELGYGRH